MEEEVKAWVKSIFDETGRDESHGFGHAVAVWENSQKILQGQLASGEDSRNKELSELVMCVALLHDVSDHKYDPKGHFKTRMVDMLSKYYTPDYKIDDRCVLDLILNIIDRISYSKENKARVLGKDLDWLTVLGDTGCLVRDVVSDADKLEAIGIVGVERCLEYTKESHPEYTEAECVEQLVIHAEEKLFRLKTEFIRTDLGQALASPLHDEMVAEVARLAQLHHVSVPVRVE